MTTTPTDQQRAIDGAWQCLADACTEHDCEHERRAIDRLIALGELPAPRPASSGS